MVKNYIPHQKDIIYLDFNPTIGHEQKGRRLALVLSNYAFNKFTKMALVCPITSNMQEFPLHVKLDDSVKTKGVVMCEQIKVVDFVARNASFKEKIDNKTYEEVLMVINSFISLEEDK